MPVLRILAMANGCQRQIVLARNGERRVLLVVRLVRHDPRNVPVAKRGIYGLVELVYAIERL